MRPTTPQLEQFLGCLEKQEAAIEQLAGHTAEQQHLIEAGSTDALMRLLTTRQTLIDDITARHRQLSDCAHAMRAGEIPVDEQQRSQIRERLATLSARLGEILERDERAQQQLATQRDQTRSDLRTHDAASTARRAYAASTTSTLGDTLGNNRFTDQQG